MNRLMGLGILSICLSFTLKAEWDPIFIERGDKKSKEVLSNPYFVALKKKVSLSLTNSWCSNEKIHLLMDLTVLCHPKVCVEIGVFSGSSLLPVASTLKHLNSGKIYAIDAWSNEESTKYLGKEDPNCTWWAQVDMLAAHNSFHELIKTWDLKKVCKEIFKSSEYAIYDIPEKIDFLHLDGDYSENGSLRDVELYLPKVKPGGYILLSNFYLMINREQPKIKAFCALCEACEVICSIENDNAILFKKN